MLLPYSFNQIDWRELEDVCHDSRKSIFDIVIIFRVNSIFNTSAGFEVVTSSKC